ncbi:MAG: hypothetical protein JXX14_00355 [Deltaproteobacteria bacterium]|nr:hypothetical protein [Deltaproteobacteria bacterium]
MNQKNNTLQTDTVISVRSADRMPRSIVFDGGFKILGTPLAFKGCRHPGLLFISELNMKIPPGTRRVIGSETAIGAMGHRKKRLDTIAVSWDRLFKLGKMDLRLLPSGMGPGASLLEIKYRDRIILYCSGLRTAQPLSGAPLPVTACDILLLDFNIATFKSPAPRTLKPQFLTWQKAHSNNFATAVLCDTAPSVFDVLHTVEDTAMPVLAHSTIYNLLRETAIAENKKLTVRRLGKQWPTTGLVISGSRAFFKSAHAKNAGIPVCICGPKESSPDNLNAFPFGVSEHLAGLVQFAKKCGAGTVAISPTGGETAADAFIKAGFDVHYSRAPRQLKLPL